MCNFFQIISSIPCHFLYLHQSSHHLPLLINGILMAVVLRVLNKIIYLRKAGISVNLVNTIRGKILEGARKFWRINGSKVFGGEKFGESVGSILKILAFINIGGENFGELPTVCQSRQKFPPPKFSHIRY